MSKTAWEHGEFLVNITHEVRACGDPRQATKLRALDEPSEQVPLRLSRRLHKRLAHFAEEHKVPVLSLMIGSWVWVVGRWSGQDQVVVTVWLSSDSCGEGNRFGARKSQLTELSATLRDDLTFEQFGNELRLDSLRAAYNPSTRFASESNVVVEHRETRSALWLSQAGGGDPTKIAVRCEKLDSGSIQQMASGWKVFLRGILVDPRKPVRQLRVMTRAQHYQVLHSFNATATSFQSDRLIHELFEEQVTSASSAVALVEGTDSVTFGDLNKRANKAARRLRQHGVGADQLVAICMERGVDMVVAMLAVLKAGGAYLPLDPAYPTERLIYMLKDAAPRMLITRRHLADTLCEATTDVLAIEEGVGDFAELDDANLSTRAFGVTPDNLAYVIYTSGSTGLPKAAMNVHRGMVNRITTHESIEAFASGDICCQKTSIGFVDAVFEIFGALCNGLTLVVIPTAAVINSAEMTSLIEQEHVTRLITVPSLARSMLESRQIMRDLMSLRTWTLSGEPVQPDLLMQLQKELPGCEFINQYGSSEVSSDAACHRCSTHLQRVPIGKPVPNVQIYILDKHGEPAPPGAVGEIYVGGVGVGRGYLHRPELTAERFLPDRFDIRSAARMYRTGDLGRWRADGSLECLGRSDNQVKIRGVRVELGEIETQLTRQGQVREAVVVMREDMSDSPRLVAYVTLRSDSGLDVGNEPTVEVLRARLRAVLPEHMVPVAIVMMSELPRTPNGKLDRQALPKPWAQAHSTKQYAPPEGEIENMLAAVWQDLLGVERVSRHDNFFELGGHSLLLVQMIERMRRRGLVVDARSLFVSPILSELARTATATAVVESEAPAARIPLGCSSITADMLTMVELDPEHIECIVQTVKGGAGNIEDIYPLTPIQEGILFHHLLEEDHRNTYVLPTLLCLSSRVILELFIEALQSVVNRHDILRTAVLWEGLPRSVQVVYREARVPVEQIVLDPERDVLQQFEQRMRPERQRMGLQCAPLIRLQVTADPQSEKWYVLLQVHHIVCDNQSLEILVAQVRALVDGRTLELAKPAPYRNHVAAALAAADTRESEGFFQKKLGDIVEPTAPFGLLGVHGETSRIIEVRKTLGAVVATSLRAQARRLSVSPATLFHAAWGLVVSHTSGLKDVVYGSVMLGRLNAASGAQRMVGMFINTLPLRLCIDNLSVTDLVVLTQRELAELMHYEQTSLAVAQRCSGVGASQPLFSTILNYLHFTPDLATVSSGSESQIQIVLTQGWTNYPIAISVEDHGDGFVLLVSADCRVDALRVADYLQTALHSLVTALESAPQIRALSLPILPASERHEIVSGFNATEVTYPEGHLVHELFEDVARRAPDAPAVVCEERCLTYLELNRRANQLAHYLIQRGLKVGEYVPLLMPRCLEMLVAQLAVLKCGGAYVPIDPNLPVDRQAFMLKDCGAKWVVVQNTVHPDLELESLQWIDCTIVGGGHSHLSVDNPRLWLPFLQPAYIMYTSGSTGAPKGVLVSHRAIIRLAINNGFAQIMPTDCIAHCSNPAFDASTFEVWGGLLSGARVVIVPQSVVLDPDRLMQLLRQHRVTVLWLTVGLFVQYADALASVSGQFNYLLTGGDVVDPSAVRKVMRQSKPQRLLNGYGPTECTTFSTTWLIEEVTDDTKTLPIGRPLSNTQIYILSRDLEPVPIGVAGEIYIGGDGVAFGYINRADLTAERFIADPFIRNRPARLYKTGDLGRWRPDGAVEYLGRNDHQVKIRGFRVELGEIETQLAGYPGVKEAIILAREEGQGEKRLVAYVMPSTPSPNDLALSPQALRGYLKSLLPEYMIPCAFVMLKVLPLTPNGKVDRRSMPAPEPGDYVSRQYESPRSATEKTVAAIWQELLQVERIGRQDNFFELGGHSLLVLKALFGINGSLGTTLSVADVYRNPTVLELAERIEGSAPPEEFLDLAQEATFHMEVPTIQVSRCWPPRSILVTGCTGFVGRFLLARLLQDTEGTVFCLVRARSTSQALSRLRNTLLEWDLWTEGFDRRVVAVPGDLSLPRLGIDESDYDVLSREVDTIYHCATSMNHLESYLMAKPTNVGGAREVLKLATREKLKLVNYISTLSVFSSGNGGLTRVVDETTPIDHERHPSSDGYGASKWVGEKIFLLASEQGVPCNIFRLGLVWADGEQGRYDELQWEYRLFKSCLLSGFGIKNYRYDMPPTPVDYVARALVHLASEHPEGKGIFHISSIGEPTEDLFERYNEITGISLPLLPDYEWISVMRRLHNEGHSLPVVPLIESLFGMDEESFQEYRRGVEAGRPRFDCQRTVQKLQRAGIEAPVVDDRLLRRYLESLFLRDRELKKLSKYSGGRRPAQRMTS
jgi:amino acid adenylation domain-containing protein/thioester reductase-like protein